VTGSGRIVSGATRLASIVLLGLAPACVVAFAFVAFVPTDAKQMADFHVFWHVGREVLEGSSHGFVYPAPAALMMVPFALIPYGVAAALFTVLLVATIPLLLLALGVRDWRCHGAALLGAPTIAVLGAGALSSLLALAAALAWRYRDRRFAVAFFVGAAIVAKIFLWPLLVWLIATRRSRAAAIVVGGGAAAAFAGWAAIGFAGLREYPALLGSLASSQQADGYAPVSLGLALGLPSTAARALALVVGFALLGLALARGRRPGGDRTAFTLAVAASLALSPVVWLHYFVLLLVPIALARPRFTPLWLAPVALWACSTKSNGDLGLIVVALAVTAVVVGLCLRGRHRGLAGGHYGAPVPAGSPA
jgi:glycosyl transferase family 87